MNLRVAPSWRFFAATLLVATTGCAAIAPQPHRKCGNCSPPQGQPGYSLSRLKRDFDHLVIGVDYEEPVAEAAKPGQQPPASAPVGRDLHAPLASLAEVPPGDLVERLPAPPADAAAAPCLDDPQLLASPADAAPVYDAEPASCELPLPPPALGPPGRFFPVPARPVFSPAYPAGSIR